MAKFRRKKRSSTKRRTPVQAVRPVRRSSRPRRARRALVRSNPSMMPVVLANPQGHRSRKRRRIGRVGTVSRKRRSGRKAFGRRQLRRRSNPMGGALTIAGLVRVGASGVLGIMTARVGKNMYNRYLSASVRGNGGESWRAWLDEAMRVVAQELAVILVERTARKANIGSPADRSAFFIGGSAETARSALSSVVARLSPSTDRGRFGLDGPPGYYDESTGRLMQLNRSTGQYELAGIVSREEFAGVMSAEQFSN